MFPEKYHILHKNCFEKDGYAIVPIRYEDRMDIMRWRNEQIYHLRQAKPLTEEDQENYFENVVARSFEEEKPNQVLFSYLKNKECIGYGGLVHINWRDKNAEISFIINPKLEQNEFKQHWGLFLDLLEQVAFNELHLHKIFTYAFDLRSHLYEAVEAKGYNKEAVLKEHFLFNGIYKDVIIHSKLSLNITVREMTDKDKKKTFQWANDPLARENSFHSEPILFENHSSWFDRKLESENAFYFICEVDNHPAGLVRFDYNDKKSAYIIGITIDKKYRGKKLATTFLKIACQEFINDGKKIPIVAFIKETNISSIKAFERTGFKFNSKIKIDSHHESLKYIYEG